MEGELSILTPIVQYIFAGFCVVLVAQLILANRRLFKERDDDFEHIKKTLDGLPCLTHAEQLRQQEKILNGLLERSKKPGEK